MGTQITIVGSYLSPYVRKVLVCLHLKGIPYEIDPIVPFYGNDQFSKISPLRRIPVLMDGAVTLSDSTVICEYLDERYPWPPLLPQGTTRRALSRWYEEYADTRMGEVLIWHLYNQVIIRRFVWGEAPDNEMLAKAHSEEIPAILDYLEAQLPHDGFLFGPVGIADIALASFFRNAQFAKYEIDPQRWPLTANYVVRVLNLSEFQQLDAFERLSLKTPIQQHREALQAAGAPISAQSFGGAQPRRGILSI